MKKLLFTLALLAPLASLQAMECEESTKTITKHITQAINQSENLCTLILAPFPEATEENSHQEITDLPLRGRLVSLPPSSNIVLEKSIALRDGTNKQMMIIAPHRVLSLEDNVIDTLSELSMVLVNQSGNVQLGETQHHANKNIAFSKGSPVKKTAHNSHHKNLTEITNRTGSEITLLIFPFTDPQKDFHFGETVEKNVRGRLLCIPALSSYRLSTPIPLAENASDNNLLVAGEFISLIFTNRDIQNRKSTIKLVLYENSKIRLENDTHAKLRNSPFENDKNITDE